MKVGDYMSAPQLMTINSSVGRLAVWFVDGDLSCEISPGQWVQSSILHCPTDSDLGVTQARVELPIKLYGKSGAAYDLVSVTSSLGYCIVRSRGTKWFDITNPLGEWGIQTPILYRYNGQYGVRVTQGTGVNLFYKSRITNETLKNVAITQVTSTIPGYIVGQYVGDSVLTYIIGDAAHPFPTYDITGNQYAALTDIIEGLTPIEPPSTDPYAPGGTSQPGGGGGSFGGNTNPASTDVTNNIDIPPLPPAGTSAVNTGFITLFTPTTAELKNLADYMWSTSLFDLDTWQKLFANPMDALIGLSIVPVAVPSSGQSAVTVGNISTGVSMTKASSQYVSVNCGSIDFTEFWKGYLDYNPYTKVEIYLPYIGTRPISADDVMGKTVTVQYNIDVLSGACAAYIKCGDSVLYNFVGQCSCSIPISGGDMTQVINGTLSIAASIGAMAETGGMSAAAVGATLSTAANTIKTTVEKSGCISGMGGMLGIQTPYVIITRPRQALPENQNKFTGYPAFITATVGASAGYTEIEKVHLENIPATSAELAEIENLLKGGVIV